MEIDENRYEYASPNASSLIQSLRAFGYHISTAIADLLDNSISAKAKNINVQFEWNDGNPWIAIFDDGCGMTAYELVEAMKLGSKSPLDERKENDLGRFGLGLKTASFSQCKCLTVMTKTQNTDIAVRCWDLDLVTQYNYWVLKKYGSENSEAIAKKFFTTNSQGTIVLLEKIDRIVPDNFIDNETYQEEFLANAKRVSEHISTVFSGYMYGKKRIKFSLNNNEIKLWDPFALESPLTTEMPTETLFIDNKEIKIKTYILPHVNKLTVEEYAKIGGPRGWTDQQGFYVYRNNRLIVSGDWLLNNMQKKEQYKLARIRVDITNSMDEEWGIDVRKSIAVPPVAIQSEMKRIANIAQRESSKIYKHRGKKIARSINKEESFIWHQNIKYGKIGYKINRDHILIKTLIAGSQGKEIKKLLELIEETIPIPMIISDYSENSEKLRNPYEGKETDKYDEILENLFNLYIQNGFSPNESLSNIANSEPFIYMVEKIEIFKEKKGL